MVNGRLAPPKCLFHAATETEKSIYSNRKINIFGLVKNWHLLTLRTQLATYITI